MSAEPRPAAPEPPPGRSRPAKAKAQETHLSEYLAIVKRRKWVILIFSALVVGLVALYAVRLPRVYRATAQIAIERQIYTVTNTEERANRDIASGDFYETQYALLVSRGLALEVLENLGPKYVYPWNLERPDSVFERLKRFVLQRAPEPPVGAADRARREEELLVKAYLGSLAVAPVKDTRLVNISFSSYSPEVAARVANAHSRAFIESNLQVKVGAAQQGLKMLDRQVAEQKAKLEASQAAVQRYLRNQDVVSFEERQNIVSQKLMELNSDLTRAKNERIARQAIYDQMNKVDFAGDRIYSLPEVARDNIILGLRNQIIQLKSRQIELSSNFGPKHPRMIEVSTRIRELEEEKQREIERLQGTIKAEMDRARDYEESLQQALAEQKRAAQALGTKTAEYNVLTQEVRSNQDAYDLLLKQAKEMRLTSGLETGNVRMVDEAKVPGKPVESQKTMYVLLAVFVSLFAGTFLAFFLEYMDQSVKTSDDIKTKLQLPVLGMVPHYRFPRRGKAQVLLWDDPKLKKIKPVKDYYYYYGVNAANRLIQHLQWRVQQDQGRVFAMVSAGAGEGKTTIVANVARVLARRGLRVLALDADIHHPSLHGMFGLNGSGGGWMGIMKTVLPKDPPEWTRVQPGMTNTPVAERVDRLELSKDLENQLLSSVVVVEESLSLLLAGEGNAELSGVFSLALLGKTLARLRALFDVILVDTPPLLEVAEAVPLATMVDGVVLVVRAGQLPEKVLVEAVEALKNAEAKILGAVLNDLKQ